jgi:hypothetical protein
MTREEGQKAVMLVATVRAMATVKMDLVMV